MIAWLKDVVVPCAVCEPASKGGNLFLEEVRTKNLQLSQISNQSAFPSSTIADLVSEGGVTCVKVVGKLCAGQTFRFAQGVPNAVQVLIDSGLQIG